MAKLLSDINLFEVTNNTINYLRQTLAVSGKYIILYDASKFPDSGILKITSASSNNLLDSHEVIFYGKRIGNQLHSLTRSYNGTSAKTWPVGSKVSCPLMAEHHNVLKDAIVKIQQKIGLVDNPTNDSLNGILNYLEKKWLAPKVIFKGFPLSGPAPLTVNFHNFSLSFGGRFLWDFGDGTTSTEMHPTHTYTSENKFNVKLVMVSPSGPQGMTEKKNYVSVNKEAFSSFFYTTPLQGISKQTSFSFIDQTNADVLERHWFFGDGKDLTINNPNIHYVDYVYEKSGDYVPSLMLRLPNNVTKKVFLSEGISVL
jgi:PKD repeat protein